MFDAYITKCSEATKPVVNYLIDTIRETVPGMEEQIKWNSPCFLWKGKMVCQVMAHKKHVSFIFLQGKLMKDPRKLLVPFGEKSNMSGFKQIESVADLPPKKILQDYIKTAVGSLKNGAL